MSDHTVKSFQNELEELQSLLIRMGGLAETQMHDAIDCLIHQDKGAAASVIEHDRKIDALELEIEQYAIKVLALRQPMADDLRITISAIKISNELERIGDLSKNIAKRALALKDPLPQSMARGIGRMGRLAQEQLHDVLDAMTTENVDQAVRVWARDEEIDSMNTSMFREVLTYMMEDPRMITMGSHLQFAAKNVERAGDHATNIAEIVYYILSGQKLVGERPKNDLSADT